MSTEAIRTAQTLVDETFDQMRSAIRKGTAQQETEARQAHAKARRALLDLLPMSDEERRLWADRYL